MTQTEIDYPIGMCVIYNNNIRVVTGYTKNRRSVYLDGYKLANQYPIYYANAFNVNKYHKFLQETLYEKVGHEYNLIVK